MLKYQTLRKKLIKNGIIALVAVSVTGAVAFGVASWSTALQEDAQKAKNSLSAAERNVSAREQKQEDAQEYMDLYRQITGTSEQARISDLSSNKAQAWLKTAAQNNGIANLQGSFEPTADIANPEFKKKTLQGISAVVELKFGAMTDVQLYRFIETIMQSFPGYVKVTKLTITRSGEITDNVIASAGRGRFPELVTAEMIFNWIGVREVEAEADANADAGAPPLDYAPNARQRR